jgi:hypothetical protein
VRKPWMHLRTGCAVRWKTEKVDDLPKNNYIFTKPIDSKQTD